MMAGMFKKACAKDLDALKNYLEKCVHSSKDFGTEGDLIWLKKSERLKRLIDIF